MNTLRLTLLAAAAALVPVQAQAWTEPAVLFNNDSTEQGSSEVTPYGPGDECVGGFDEVNGLCVPQGDASSNQGEDDEEGDDN